MHARRRTWGTAIAGAAIVALGAFADRPLLVVAGVPLAAWLIGRQASAVRAFRAVDDRLTVSVSTARAAVAVDEPVRVTVSARFEGPDPAPAPVSVTVPLPVGATGASRAERTLEIPAGEREAASTFSCSFRTAGRFDFPSATVTVRSLDDLFDESLTRASKPTVRADPRTPSDLHVGAGGEALSYGDHPGGRSGGGITPEELREYQPGDAADRIDWKATARHGQIYVREFEPESDRRTVVILDHRARTDLGPAGATLFAYLREVALGFVDGAEALSDPVGCRTVGDDGITGRFDATSASAGYDRIRAHLRELTPTEGTRTVANDGESAASDGVGAAVPTTAHAETAGHAQVRPAAAAARADRLTDDTPFAERVRPFLEARDSYVRRLRGDALFGAVERARADVGSTALSVIVTDDADRDRLLEAVRLATRGGAHALVFVAPRVLFDADDPADPETAYERYLEFERFRRTLDGITRVTAFEVGPGDRLDRLLAAGRRQRR
ncbi:DUF58 domain-containing protein [Halobaculum magnesiiphilum]|uniref:DUF58 domain-containing protein n=1 Tax=Halobaculum magnesiiphilum TaxID=1017351 RepID=A0A8T8WF16_9EURY|nr:DUF58 domain-containing protein [Halobaculum magnesiiphilum]QZP38447.1 DUF58 domain-containing protein [Halobaculum magnesiiphilum]